MDLNPADNLTEEQIAFYVKDEYFCELVIEISLGKYNNIVDVPVCDFSPVQGKFLIARVRLDMNR